MINEPLDQTIHMPWHYSAEPEFPAENMDVTPPGPPTEEVVPNRSGFHPTVLGALTDLGGLSVNGMPIEDPATHQELQQNWSGQPMDRTTSQWQINRNSPVTVSHADPEQLEAAKQVIESGGSQPVRDYLDRTRFGHKDIVQPGPQGFNNPNVHKALGNLNVAVDGRPYRNPSVHRPLIANHAGDPVEIGAANPQELDLARQVLHSGDDTPVKQYRMQQAQTTAKKAGLLGTIGGVAGGLLGSEVPGVGNVVGGLIGSGIGSAAGDLLGGGGDATSSVHHSDLETPSSVPSIGEHGNDPSEVDQREFDVGPDMHNNLYDPSVDGDAGGATTGKGLDPQGKASRMVQDNMPVMFEQAVLGNHDHPTLAEARRLAQEEYPDLKGEDHHDTLHQAIRDGVKDNFYKMHGRQSKTAQLGSAIEGLTSSLGGGAGKSLMQGAAKQGLGMAAASAAGGAGGAVSGSGADTGGTDVGDGAGPGGGMDTGGDTGGGMTAPDDSSPPMDQQIAESHIAADEDHLEAPPDEHEINDGNDDTNDDNSQSLDPNSRSIRLIITNLPDIMKHYFSPESGANDPLIQMIQQALDSDSPGWQSEDNDQEVSKFFDQLLGTGAKDSKHSPDDNSQMEEEDKTSHTKHSIGMQNPLQMMPGMQPGGMPGGAPGGQGGQDPNAPDPSTSQGGGPPGGPQMPGGGNPGAGDMGAPDASTSQGGGGAGAATAPPGGAGGGQMPGQPGQGTSCPHCGGPMVGGMCQHCQGGGGPSAGGGAAMGGGAGGGAGSGMHSAPPGNNAGTMASYIANDPSNPMGLDPEEMLNAQQQQMTQQDMQQGQQQFHQKPDGDPATQEQDAANVWQALTPDHNKTSFPPNHPGQPQPHQQGQDAGVVVPQGMQGMQPQGVPPVPPAPGGLPFQGFGNKKSTLGPDSPDQKSAVADYLLENGRQDEIPIMIAQPEQYEQELALVQRKDYKPLPNDQPTQEPPPAQEEAPPGDTMPVPNMQVQQSLKRAIAKYAVENEPIMHHAPGDNGDFSKNVLNSPAAEQEQQFDPRAQEDSSGTWADSNGNPLEPGQIYEMSSRSYDIPDIVRITRVKPDSITYEIEGEYNLRHETEITREEAQIDGLQFAPAGEGPDSQVGPEDFQQPDFGRQPGEGNTVEQAMPDQGDMSTPHMMTGKVGAAPDFMYEPSQPPTIPEGMTIDQYNQQGRPADPHAISQSGHCPNCGNPSLVPGQYCANCERARSQSQRAVPNWNNPNATQTLQASRDWLLDDGDDFSREAGAKYTPMEQREFVDEPGSARNRDKLDLSNTHYEQSHDLEEELFLGI